MFARIKELCHRQKAQNPEQPLDINPVNAGGRSWKPSAKTMKRGAVALVALLIIAAVGVTLATHFGALGQHAQSILQNKILSPIHMGLTSELPAWVIPTTAGGMLALGGAVYGVRRGIQYLANRKAQETSNVDVTSLEEDTASA